jgi:hypothetical protein
MSDENYEALKSGCCLVKVVSPKGVQRHGTGFLVGQNQIATCFHVVSPTSEGGTLSVVFEEMEVSAKIYKTNEPEDCAVLEISKSPSGTTPLPLGGVCGWKAEWDGYGFPVVAQDAGIFLDGIVSDPKGKDDKKRPSIHLWSRQVGSGMGTPLGGFSGSPVIIKGLVVGQLRRIIPIQQGVGQPLPALGMVYATPAGPIASLVGAKVACTGAPQEIESRVTSADRVISLLEKWTAAGMPRDSATLLTAESLIQLGFPDKALTLLEKVGKGVRRDQLLALALAKTKKEANITQAITILEKLRGAGNLDAETSGILAGRYKQRWEQNGDVDQLEKAYNIYAEAYELTHDSYPGINAAALALQLGKTTESKEFATSVSEELNGLTEDMLNHWQLATVAEAALLTRNVTKAKECYRKAINRYPEAKENIERMYLQAKFNLRGLSLQETVLDEVFRPA